MYRPLETNTVSDREVHVPRVSAAVERTRRVEESARPRNGRLHGTSAALASALRRAADHLDPSPAPHRSASRT